MKLRDERGCAGVGKAVDSDCVIGMFGESTCKSSGNG